MATEGRNGGAGGSSRWTAAESGANVRDAVSVDQNLICKVICKVIGKVTCQRESCSCKAYSPTFMKKKAVSLKVEAAKMRLQAVKRQHLLHKAANTRLLGFSIPARFPKLPTSQDQHVATPAFLRDWPGKQTVELAGSMVSGKGRILQFEGKDLDLNNVYGTKKTPLETVDHIPVSRKCSGGSHTLSRSTGKNQAANGTVNTVVAKSKIRQARMQGKMLTLRNLVIPDGAGSEVLAYMKSDEVMLEEAISYVKFLQDQVKALKEHASHQDTVVA